MDGKITVSFNEPFYLITGFDHQGCHHWGGWKLDSRYNEEFKNHTCLNVFIGNCYLIDGYDDNDEERYFIALNEQGGISDIMTQKEVQEHFKFVEAST